LHKRKKNFNAVTRKKKNLCKVETDKLWLPQGQEKIMYDKKMSLVDLFVCCLTWLVICLFVFRFVCLFGILLLYGWSFKFTFIFHYFSSLNFTNAFTRSMCFPAVIFISFNANNPPLQLSFLIYFYLGDKLDICSSFF